MGYRMNQGQVDKLIQRIIRELKEIDVDGETMQHICEEVLMFDQVGTQWVRTTEDQWLLREALESREDYNPN